MPRKMIADVDDITQLRSMWVELVNVAVSMNWSREEIAGVVTSWIEKLIDKE